MAVRMTLLQSLGGDRPIIDRTEKANNSSNGAQGEEKSQHNAGVTPKGVSEGTRRGLGPRTFGGCL